MDRPPLPVTSYPKLLYATRNPKQELARTESGGSELATVSRHADENADEVSRWRKWQFALTSARLVQVKDGGGRGDSGGAVDGVWAAVA
jgi:hypothetical protein